MLGLMCLGLTCLMIYTLVKNALLGKQLSKEDHYAGTIELLIPVTPTSEFFLEAWQDSMRSFHFTPGQLKVHLLIDGHHPSLNAWTELKSKLPYLHITSFPMRPTHVEAVPWMLEQISSKITSDMVIIGDAELVPTEHAFLSAAKLVSDKKRPYLILPQTGKFNLLGEAIAVLNPTLAFVSSFGKSKWRQYICHPLLSLSQGWMIMDQHLFRSVDFKSIRISNWKEAIARQWDERDQRLHLAFGEKHLLRFYPEDMKGLMYQMRDRWDEYWNRKDKRAFWFYVVILFLWSFPVIFLFTRPFQAMASFMLLILYRFFTKIVFQETWKAIILHPVGTLVWLWTLVWWLSGSLRSKYGSQARLNP